jgi:glycosyltransferase involved in cell wall biosynthesis
MSKDSKDVGMKDYSAPDLPLVAVVTPVYNGAAYLEATMRCVQRQTYDRLVHVIVDNCSTDDTPEIIDRYRHQRVQLITTRNESLVPLKENWTRALCGAPAEATYLKFLCADDLIRSDCIARFVEVAESDKKVEVVLSHDIFVDMVRRANLPLEQNVFDGIRVAGMMLNESINWLPYHHLFVRSHGVAQNARLFDDTPIHFDFSAVVRSTLAGKLGYVHEPLVYTRWHDNSITSQQIGANQVKHLLERFDILCAFGARCWDDAAFQHEKERMLGRLMRLAVKWSVKQRWDAIQELQRWLEEREIAPSVTDWAGSIVDWIPYAKWKRTWRIPFGPEIDEAKFCSEKF